MTITEILNSDSLYPSKAKYPTHVQEEIRKKHVEEGVSQTQLSREYGVSRGTIQNYIRGEPVYKDEITWSEDQQEEWNTQAREKYLSISSKYNTTNGVKRG